MGRKSQTKDSDLSEIKRLRLENQKLKQEISKLRKNKSRLRKVVSRYEDHYEEVIDSAMEADQEIIDKNSARDNEKLLKQWKCFACSDGYLVIWHFDRPDGRFYKRKCSSCKYSTRLKPSTDEVKGITHEKLDELLGS